MKLPVRGATAAASYHGFRTDIHVQSS